MPSSRDSHIISKKNDMSICFAASPRIPVENIIISGRFSKNNIDLGVQILYKAS